MSSLHPVRSLSERARQLTRAFLPHGAYGLLASSLDWGCAVRKLGWRQSRRLWRAHPDHASDRSGDWVRVEPTNLSYPFYVRSATTDVDEFLYTVARESYGRYLPGGEVSFILDAGANNGDSAAWLLTRFARAQLIAVEPDRENFSILKRNCEPYGARVALEHCAVWFKPARLSLKGNERNDAIEVFETADGECRGVTVPWLMSKYGFPRLDIFKCDIEGTERQLFSQGADEWLSKTGFVVIEVHGSECLKAVVEATRRYGFTHRELDRKSVV